jgi:hypothetical protein
VDDGAVPSALSHVRNLSSGLFNNMKLPATILAGAMVPLGLLSPLPLQHPDGEEETRFRVALRHAYSVTAVLSLVSELISVMWSTVAVNKLIETTVRPATSVWDLLKRDFDLPWAGTNAHFVAGMWGFMVLIAIRTYFYMGAGRLGRSVAGLCGSGLLLMVAIVNRGVAAGSGDGLRYGANVAHLVSHYVTLLCKQAFRPRTMGPLEMAALIGVTVSSIEAARGIWLTSYAKEKSK